MAFDTGLADRIRLILPRNRAISERKMFGGLAFLMNGHMFCGVVKTDLMLRLGEETTPIALRLPHTRPMDFTGKPLKSMLYVDAGGIDSDESLQAWVESALTYVTTLRPKE
jgi:TfoX/Sxy family transcriptional regulator of competence genes